MSSGRWRVLVLGSLLTVSAPRETASCPVTAPNGRMFTGVPSGGNHGNEALVTGLVGEVRFRPGGSGCVEPDGLLGMKWPWWRLTQGTLTIEGRRLDRSAPPLRAHIPRGYGDVGFQSTALLFPTPGCWEVTGRVGNARLTFVTRVLKTGSGPKAHCAELFGGYSQARAASGASGAARRQVTRQ